MPVVPKFQDYVPQVSDNAATGRMVIEAPKPTVDYEGMFLKASKVLAYGVDKVSTVMETEHARDVKAASDEAEDEYIKQVHDVMYNPETGYMIQQGRNANERLQPTIVELQKRKDKILERLSPEVRDAVQSRLNDRFLTARGQSMQWGQGQTQKWHIDSATSRIESLLQDASNHYADTEYLSKSWLSIAQEAGYVGNLAGLDEDSKKKATADLYDQFQIARYTRWAEDDPSNAFQSSRAEQGHMSAKGWSALDDSLWNTCKRGIAFEFSQVLRLKGSDWQTNPKGVLKRKTGIPVIDGLTDSRKVEIYSLAGAFVKQSEKAEKVDISRAVRISIAKAGQEGIDPNKLTYDWFLGAHGGDEEKAKLAYGDYLANYSAAEFGHHCKDMANGDIMRMLEEQRPDPNSPTYDTDVKAYIAKQKAAGEVFKARSIDPIESAFSDEFFAEKGIKPIDWDGDWESQVATRVQYMLTKYASEDYGTPIRFFSKQEAKMLNDRWDRTQKESEGKPVEPKVFKASPADGAEFFVKLANLARTGDRGELNQTAIANQLEGDARDAFLLACNPATADTVTDFLIGRQALINKDARVTPMKTDSTIGTARVWEAVQGIYPTPDLEESAVNLIEGVAGAYVVRDGLDISTALSKATETVVGKIINYNNHNISVRGDWSSGDIDFGVEAITNLANQHKDEKFAQVNYGARVVEYTGAGFAEFLKTAQLRNSGVDDEFYVVHGNRVVLNMNGDPFIVKPGSRPSMAKIADMTRGGSVRIPPMTEEQLRELASLDPDVAGEMRDFYYSTGWRYAQQDEQMGE